MIYVHNKYMIIYWIMHQKYFHFVQKFPKLILTNILYVVIDLKPRRSAMISAIVIVVERFVFIMMITCHLGIIVILYILFQRNMTRGNVVVMSFVMGNNSFKANNYQITIYELNYNGLPPGLFKNTTKQT